MKTPAGANRRGFPCLDEPLYQAGTLSAISVKAEIWSKFM